MVFQEGDDFRALRRPGDDPAQFRSLVRQEPVPTAPNSVIHQYRGDNFTASTWSDSVGNADMTVSGLSSGTLNSDPAVVSDGVDDGGVASGPETLGSNTSWGIAFVYSGTDLTDTTAWMGVLDGDFFQILDRSTNDGSNGELRFNTAAGGPRLNVETSSNLTDGTARLIILNKNGDDASQINWYAGTNTSQVRSPIPSVINRNDPGYDSSAFSVGIGMGFFARNASGLQLFKSFTASFFEFNTEPYDQTERQEIFNRVGGV